MKSSYLNIVRFSHDYDFNPLYKSLSELYLSILAKDKIYLIASFFLDFSLN